MNFVPLKYSAARPHCKKICRKIKVISVYSETHQKRQKIKEAAAFFFSAIVFSEMKRRFPIGREQLRPVSTTSVEKSILSLFYCFFFALASILTARFNRRSIKERKNALFHARSGNGPLFSNFFNPRCLMVKGPFPLRAWKRAFFVSFI